MDERSDETLVAAVQDGNIFAFEHLVRRYQRKLHSFVLHIVRDDQAAADVVQDSLINLYKTIDRVDTKKKFSTYVFSIARNTAISFLRAKRREVSLDDVVMAGEDEALFEELVQMEKQHTVGQALKRLDERYRKVIQLYYFDDLSYEEMSRKLRKPINTVRTHLSRAKAALRKLLIYETH